MKKKYYELWGYEAFQRETYLIGIYENKEEAEATLAEADKEVSSQDIVLRDKHWIVETTLEEIIKRKLNEKEIDE